jgi:hypothetical protein
MAADFAKETSMTGKDENRVTVQFFDANRSAIPGGAKVDTNFSYSAAIVGR